MVFRRRRLLLAAVLLASTQLGCRIDFVLGPSVVVSSGGDRLLVGQPRWFSVAGSDPTCLVDGAWHPCRTFSVVPPHSGFLSITVRWSEGSHRIALRVLDQHACCVSPLLGHSSVVGGRSYEVLVVMLPLSGPLVTRSAVQHFELSASLQ